MKLTFENMSLGEFKCFVKTNVSVKKLSVLDSPVIITFDDYPGLYIFGFV